MATKTKTEKREVVRDTRPQPIEPIICQSCGRPVDLITARCGCFRD